MKTLVFGMAKSSLDIDKAGKSKSLELDVLRMIRLIEKYTTKDVRIIGFILVYDEDIMDRIIKWFNKYEYNNLGINGNTRITILTFKEELTAEQRQSISEEKEKNATTSMENGNATVSEQITEEILKCKI